MKMSFADVSELRINFGEAKLNQRYIDVAQEVTVCKVVRQDVRQEREDQPQVLPVLPQPVCGATGADSGTMGTS